jgi:UPF0716 family protein affecting phage T7 exclusion
MLKRFPFLTSLILICAWIAAEMSIFNLVAGWTGGLMAFLLFVLKSVAGFAFVGQLVRRKMASMGNIQIVALDPSKISAATLKIIGAILLVMPGFLAGVIGLAFLTPSVRSILAARQSKKHNDPRDIELQADDWREIPPEPVNRIRRRKNPDNPSDLS